MTRKVIFCLFLVATVLFGSTGYAYDRYIFVVQDEAGCRHYFDSQSVVYDGNMKRADLWLKEEVTDEPTRTRMIARERNSHIKKALKKSSHVLTQCTIDFSRNRYAFGRSMYYSHKGSVLYTYEGDFSWEPIVPGTYSEVLKNRVEDFCLRFHSNQRGTMSPSQQNSWQQFQEYQAWLYAKPDYPEFNRWYVMRLREK